MTYTCEKVQLHQLRTTIYSIVVSLLHIFLNFFLTDPQTYLYNTLRKSHDFIVLF